MKTISNIGDLERYGIIPLTGESDGLGFRLLCDLTAAGRALLRETFGMAYDCQFGEPWNSGSEADPHLGSVLLWPECYLKIGVIALFTVDKCHTMLGTDNAVYGLEEGEEFIPAEGTIVERAGWVVTREAMVKLPRDITDEPVFWPKHTWGEIRRVYRHFRGHPHVGTRNVHTMSGRTH